MASRPVDRVRTESRSARHPYLRVALAIITMAAVFAAIPGSTSPAEAGQGFWDDDDSQFQAEIEAIANAGITAGCNPPDNTFFCDEKAVTRGQMAAFLVRALDLPSSAGITFKDDNDSIFETDIEMLAAAGITSGCNPPVNDKFCPASFVTRGQMAAFLVRALKLPAASGIDFKDDNDSIFETDIARLATAGITLGCNPPTNDKFCPNDVVTRGQMAAFLTRALDLPTKAPAFTLDPSDVALVSRYHVLDHENGNEPDIDRAAYFPRSFRKGFDVDPDQNQTAAVESTGLYAGWDVLAPSTAWKYKNLVKKDNWFQFELNRDARLGVVWRDDLPLPSWLAGWENGGTVSIDGDLVPVYEKDFSAGKVTLGSVEYTNDWRHMYVVLVAEADGKPTKTPPAPEGFTAAVPNAPCPAWVHDLHTTVGPDGKKYGTWHPQVDPTYWCYFGHDHGSDPSLIPGAPKVPYGYVADKLNEAEGNSGFKEYIFKDMDNGHWVRFVVHAMSAAQRRVCARFHTLSIEVYDLEGNQKMSVHYKADYGVAEATSDGGDGLLNPNNCGYSMAALADVVSNHQSRSINVGIASNNYERWDSRAETEATFNLGMPSFDHGFDIINPMSHCVNLTCNEVGVRDVEKENAMRRRLFMASWRADFIFDASHAINNGGTFYTNPYATAARAAGADDAVEQFIEPGFQLEFTKNATANRIECISFDPWTMQFTCMQIGGAGNLDHAPFPNDHMIERALWRN